jgi:hypothetical protein
VSLTNDIQPLGLKPTPMKPDCCHIAPSDDVFTRRMRFHQSWYRRNVLKLPPGENPAARGKLYGNLLRPEDGLAGHNFLTPDIHAVVEQRLAADPTGLEANRLRCNMLSSQPMCFNLCAPLALDLKLATKLVAGLPGLPADLEVTGIRFEYAPDKASHLNDATAFDAFIEYTLPDQRRGFIGVETKLTEPFSQTSYAFVERYSKWRSIDGWWWRDGAETDFPKPHFNQLWRNHLLAFSMLRQAQPAYDEGYCAVLYHEGAQGCAPAIDAYRACVRPEAANTLLAWPLGDVVRRWGALVETPNQRAWLAKFRLRYLDLAASADAWQAFRPGRG